MDSTFRKLPVSCLWLYAQTRGIFCFHIFESKISGPMNILVTASQLKMFLSHWHGWSPWAAFLVETWPENLSGEVFIYRVSRHSQGSLLGPGVEGGISRGQKRLSSVIFCSKDDVGTGMPGAVFWPTVACHHPMNESVLLLAALQGIWGIVGAGLENLNQIDLLQILEICREEIHLLGCFPCAG